MNINYRSISDLNSAILRNLHKFPHDVDLVVGIPRSGMLPANLLALYLNKPYTDIDSFTEGRLLDAGYRQKFIDNSSTNKILVVDDSILGGWALRKAKEKLKELENTYTFIYSVVFSTKESTQLVDVFCEIVDRPRAFQWNFFHHPEFIPRSCFDIDGVLCEDPPIDDDGELYSKYIENAPVKYLPSLEIDTLVSCRLEKYRGITERWLQKNGVKYKKLVLLDMKTKEERIKWGKHGEYKAQVYKNSDNVLFVESSLAQAKIIAKISHKPVFCTETFEMIYNKGTKKWVQEFVHSFHVILWKIKVKCFSTLHIN